MVDINLLIQKGKEVKLEKIKTIATLILAVTIGLVLFLALFLFGHKLWREKQIKDLNSKIESLKVSESAFGNLEENAKTLQNQLKNLKELLSSHVYFSSFLKILSEVTLKDVQYSSLTTDTTGTTSLTGTAKNYQSIALLITRLKAMPFLDESGQPKIDQSGQSLKVFSSVELQNSSLEKSGEKNIYRFSINLTFNEQILRK